MREYFDTFEPPKPSSYFKSFSSRALSHRDNISFTHFTNVKLYVNVLSLVAEQFEIRAGKYISHLLYSSLN